MKINSKDAMKMILEEKPKQKNDAWIGHSICVGKTAKKIAEALNKKGIHVDIDKTYTLGLIHDIGKYNGISKGHVIRGYEYLKEKGIDEEYANICLLHSYLNNDTLCTAGIIPNMPKWVVDFVKKHNYSIEEKIITLCDLMCPVENIVYTIDKRLIDIILRKGTYSNTQYHTKEAYKLKEYFDNLLGYNLYDLFPEIKNNL